MEQMARQGPSNVLISKRAPRPGPLTAMATRGGPMGVKGVVSDGGAATACEGCDCILAPSRSATVFHDLLCHDCDCVLKEACDRTPKENETRLPASSSSGGVAGPAVAGSTRSRVYMPLEDDSSVSAALAQTSIEPAARTALRLKSVTPVPLATSPVPAKAMPPELTNCPNFVTETGAAIVVISARHPSCDACMGCDDVCEFAICTECNTTRDRIRLRKCQTRAFTMCEIARGSTRDHALLTANKLVYDIGDYIKSGRHPGGERSLMKKLGTDVTRDFAMHSKAGKRMWKSLLIGKLVPCPKALCNQKKTPWKLGMW